MNFYHIKNCDKKIDRKKIIFTINSLSSFFRFSNCTDNVRFTLLWASISFRNSSTSRSCSKISCSCWCLYFINYYKYLNFNWNKVLITWSVLLVEIGQNVLSCAKTFVMLNIESLFYIFHKTNFNKWHIEKQKSLYYENKGFIYYEEWKKIGIRRQCYQMATLPFTAYFKNIIF